MESAGCVSAASMDLMFSASVAASSFPNSASAAWSDSRAWSVRPAVALCLAEEPQRRGLPEHVALRQVELVCLGQAGDGIAQSASSQVNLAEVVHQVPASAPVSFPDGGQDVQCLFEGLRCLVCLAELQADVAVVVQADPEESGIGCFAEQFQAPQRVFVGCLRSVDPEVGLY